MGKFYIHIQDSSVQHLISKDKRLANVIYQIGDLECLEHKDPFSFIVREIVEQMLSSKAARAIYARLIDLCDGQVTINNIKKLSIENLRSIGISYSKSQYVLNFAQAVENGQIDFAKLNVMSDDDIIKNLIKVKGIGSWTSKMYLIFVLQRPDVLPYEDGAFLQAYKWLYETQSTNKKEIEARCKNWKPYTSVAARYLYHALDSGLTKNHI